MDSSKEVIWKDVVGFEGVYMISNNGSVKSLSAKTNNQFSEKEYLKSISVNKYGYSVVNVTSGKTKKLCTIHRLVANAFICNPDNKPQINHINGIKTDNRVENLEWATASENQKHRFDKLNHTQHNKTISKEDAKAIRGYKKYKGIIKDLSNKHSVSTHCIKA